MDYSPYRFKRYYNKNDKKAKRPSYTSYSQNYQVNFSEEKNFEKNREKAIYEEEERQKKRENRGYFEEVWEGQEGEGYREKEGAFEEENVGFFEEHIPKDERKKGAKSGIYEVKNGLSGKAASSNKKRDFTGIFVVFVILLSFLLVIFATEFFSGGVIVKELKAAFSSGDSPTYYMLTLSPYDNEYRASTEALTVKDDGGAGYILVKDKLFYVVLATYLDKKTAEAVQQKNENTVILTMTAKTPDYGGLSGGDKKFVEKTYQNMLERLEFLYQYSSGLEGNNMTNSMVLNELTNMRNELLYLKAEVSDSVIPRETKIYLNKIIDPMFGGLDAITTISHEDCLAGAIRYVMCSTITALCD